MRLKHIVTRMAGCLAAIVLCQTSSAQPFGLWNFESGNLNSTVGANLTYLDGPGGATAAGDAFGTTTSFGIADIGGVAANVMRFPAATDGMGYAMTTPNGNGGGSLVNDYTIIFDVFYPAGSDAMIRPLLETDDGSFTGTQAYFRIDTGNGIGVAGSGAPQVDGPYHGQIAPNTWYRIGFVADAAANVIRKYINGAEVGSNSKQGIDSQFTLDPSVAAVLLANHLSGGTAAEGYVNSIQLREEALTPAQMAALAGPTADGIPQTIPAIPSFRIANIPRAPFANLDTDVGAVIDAGDATIPDGSIELLLDGLVQARTITRNGTLITVRSDPASNFAPGTVHTVIVRYTTDEAVGMRSFTNQFTAALLWEDFDDLVLGPNVDEGVDGEEVWTKTPPAGWVVDDSGIPGAGNPDTDGVTEWAGWSFADKVWWASVDDQGRSTFARASGTVAIADPDEWDDAAHTYGKYYDAVVATRTVNVAGVAAGALFVKFDSSWRDECCDDDFQGLGSTNNQTAIVTASYDGGPENIIMHWSSNPAHPEFHNDNTSEQVTVLANNPGGASSLVLRFKLLHAGNDWWWAFDNLEVNLGAIASSLLSTLPANGASGLVVSPQPTLSATVNPGTATIDPGSVSIELDGTPVTPVTLATNPAGHLIVTAQTPSVLAKLSMHSATLIYTDNQDGQRMFDWSFTVDDYYEVTLPAPLFLETFDGVNEGELPAGWSVTNNTTSLTAGVDFGDPDSDAYLNFVVINSSRLNGNPFNPQRLNVRPGLLNGATITSLTSGNLIYAESDNRGNNQVQTLFSPSYDLTGRNNVYLSFSSLYQQNQDSSGSVEYSIDGGMSWLPALYMVAEADVIPGDPVATMSTNRADQAYGLAYGDYIGAPITAALGPFIQGRVDDNPIESKRIEVLRLVEADNQADVRLRFGQSGTGSWYFGIDNVGIYAISAAAVAEITVQPVSSTTLVGCAISLSVTATGEGPFIYQWKKNGVAVAGANSATLVITRPSADDAGSYTVDVSNGAGTITSMPATLTVNPSTITGLWNFDDGDLSATIGTDLAYFNAGVQADTTYGTTTSFGIPDIAGSPANVMLFNPSVVPSGGYIMTHGAAPNAGGAFVNCYTLIFDVLYPPSSDATWRALFQTSTANANDGELFVNPGNGIGISGGYAGVVTANEWHRIAFVFNLAVSTVSKYVDGVNVANQTLSEGIDGRWSLDPTALLFADEDGEQNDVYVNSVQFRAGGMTDAEMAALGTPTATGIPMGSPLVITRIRVTSGVTIDWTGGTAPYTLQKRTSLTSGTWTDVLTTSDQTATVPSDGGEGYFRVVSRITMQATLTGAAERPTPVTTAGTGTATVTVDGHTVTVNGTFQDLSSNANNAHIHGPAGLEEAAGVMQGLSFTAATSGTITGGGVLSPANLVHLLNGNTYINLHSVMHGGGEIRGQIVP